jgi:hypothetical protein
MEIQHIPAAARKQSLTFEEIKSHQEIFNVGRIDIQMNFWNLCHLEIFPHLRIHNRIGTIEFLEAIHIIFSDDALLASRAESSQLKAFEKNLISR